MSVVKVNFGKNLPVVDLPDGRLMSVCNCARCGGEPRSKETHHCLVHDDEKPYLVDYRIRCVTCGRTGSKQYTMFDAVTAWNTKQENYGKGPKFKYLKEVALVAISAIAGAAISHFVFAF